MIPNKRTPGRLGTYDIMLVIYFRCSEHKFGCLSARWFSPPKRAAKGVFSAEAVNWPIGAYPEHPGHHHTFDLGIFVFDMHFLAGSVSLP